MASGLVGYRPLTDEPLMGKVSIFKPQAGKVFFGQNHTWAKCNLSLVKSGDLGPLPCLYA